MTTTQSPVTTTTSSTPETTTTTGTPDPDAEVDILLAPFSEMGPGWSEMFFPYGQSDDLLGTSPGGDGGSVDWGPDYGTQAADGSWWFLDAGKLRFAHFDGTGVYLDQVLVPEDVLIDGLYFQWQMPQALDDNSVVVGGFEHPLLRVDAGTLTSSDVAGNIPWATTDGTTLYGQSPDGSLLRLDPAATSPEPVEWLTSRAGTRFRVTVIEDEVLIESPDAGWTRTLRMRYSEDPDVPARAGIEFETGVDGTIFVLFYGVPMSDEIVDIGGLVTVGPDGAVGEAEPIADPFSFSDPGSPARLGITPGTSLPWLMLIGEDGVHVHQRS